MRLSPIIGQLKRPTPILHPEDLSRCIEACTSAATNGLICADACNEEENAHELQRCIRVCQDMADICAVTARIISRQLSPDWGLVRKMLQMCATTAGICVAECERFASYLPYCAECASVCRECQQACSLLMDSLPPMAHRTFGEAHENAEYVGRR